MRTRLHVIAGDAGGRNLAVPPDTRPTTGRVREALFASLHDVVVGARFLDLYAGSGAVAVEALSRGAASAVLVERDRRAAAVCRANLEATGTSPRARVVAAPVGDFLGGRVPSEAPFDVVWVDPPYAAGADELEAVGAALAVPGWLARDAHVVLERAAPRRSARGADAPASGSALEVTWERRYGDTLVTVLRPRSHPDADAREPDA